MRSNAGMADKVTPTCVGTCLRSQLTLWLGFAFFAFFSLKCKEGCLWTSWTTIVHQINFLKKLRFWKRRNDAVTRDIVTTDNRNSETGNQVSSIEMILKCHAGTQVDSILTCEATSQTSNVNERPQNRTDSGAAENGKEEMKSSYTEEAPRRKGPPNQQTKWNTRNERQRSHIQFIKTKEEMKKFPAAQNQGYERKS